MRFKAGVWGGRGAVGGSGQSMAPPTRVSGWCWETDPGEAWGLRWGLVVLQTSAAACQQAGVAPAPPSDPLQEEHLKTSKTPSTKQAKYTKSSIPLAGCSQSLAKSFGVRRVKKNRHFFSLNFFLCFFIIRNNLSHGINTHQNQP